LVFVWKYFDTLINYLYTLIKSTNSQLDKFSSKIHKYNEYLEESNKKIENIITDLKQIKPEIKIIKQILKPIVPVVKNHGDKILNKYVKLKKVIVSAKVNNNKFSNNVGNIMDFILNKNIQEASITELIPYVKSIIYVAKKHKKIINISKDISKELGNDKKFDEKIKNITKLLIKEGVVEASDLAQELIINFIDDTITVLLLALTNGHCILIMPIIKKFTNKILDALRVEIKGVIESKTTKILNYFI